MNNPIKILNHNEYASLLLCAGSMLSIEMVETALKAIGVEYYFDTSFDVFRIRTEQTCLKSENSIYTLPVHLYDLFRKIGIKGATKHWINSCLFVIGDKYRQ